MRYGSYRSAKRFISQRERTRIETQTILRRRLLSFRLIHVVGIIFTIFAGKNGSTALFCDTKEAKTYIRKVAHMIRNRWSEYRSIIAYIFFGACTTLVNIVVYYLCAHPLDMGTAASTVIGWFLSVLFAYVTNKIWVFDSRSWQPRRVVREALSFYLCRLATGALDLLVMLVTVDILGWNDLVMKILSNVLVVILNYAASKVFIFKKEVSRAEKEKEE